MKTKLFFIIFLFLFGSSYSQTTQKLTDVQTNELNRKISSKELKEDLAFLKRQIFEVHAYPWSELSKDEYEKLFASIEAKISESMTQIEFLKLVKPIIAYLSDEHAYITLPDSSLTDTTENIFLPFSIVKKGNQFVVDAVFTNNAELKKGDILESIDGILIEDVIRKCADYTAGFPDQRIKKAISRIGYFYSLAYPFKTQFKVKKSGGVEINLAGVNGKIWLENSQNNGSKNECVDKISYKKINDTGYINACSFSVKDENDLQNFETKIDQIFDQIKADKVKRIIIDVSRNDGGNSEIGDMLIERFSSKPYKTYQSNWKRSDDYLNLIKSWKLSNPFYEKSQPGDVIHYDSAIVTPQKRNNRFQGKVFVLIGKETFSSAIMFATIIKDNSIAPLIGQTPENGHPNHFGEQYSNKTPNTNLSIRFGVKEWIRPAGKSGENILTPDIELSGIYSVEEIIRRLPNP